MVYNYNTWPCAGRSVKALNPALLSGSGEGGWC